MSDMNGQERGYARHREAQVKRLKSIADGCRQRGLCSSTILTLLQHYNKSRAPEYPPLDDEAFVKVAREG